jgi:uncharacterized membrane protein
MDQLVLPIGADDWLGLRALADVSGADAAIDAAALTVWRRGLAASLEEAGLPWPTTGSDSDRPAVADPEGTDRPSGLRSRTSLVGAMAVAAVVLLVGGYGKKWSWTGFSGNNQLWDWLHLLLLPVALGTFPLWLQYAEHMGRIRKIALGVAVIAFGSFVAVGYLVPLGWTGFPGNTLWDWLTLVVLPLAVVTARAWPASKREIRTMHVVVVSVLGVAWLITLIGGYAGHWAWTGYGGNTLWDWLTLLLGPLAITTIVVPAAVRWVSGDVARRVDSEEKAKAH